MHWDKESKKQILRFMSQRPWMTETEMGRTTGQKLVNWLDLINFIYKTVNSSPHFQLDTMCLEVKKISGNTCVACRIPWAERGASDDDGLTEIISRMSVTGKKSSQGNNVKV